MNHWMWFATAASIIGAVANARKKRWGFLVWIGANTAWFIQSILTGNYPQAVVWMVFNAISLHGWWHWGKGE